MRLIFIGIVAGLYFSTTPVAGAPPPLATKLSRAAQLALVEGKVPVAASLLKGAWEISHDAEILSQLAQINAMAGQFEEAIENYQQILKLRPSPSLANQARSEIKRLRNTPAPFSDRLLQKVRVSAEARDAFKEGLRLARKKKLTQSIRYLRAALVLDPMLPGTYRVLGATYGKLGNPAKEKEFLQYYLRIRPDGKIADIVRKRLKPTGLLNQLALDASFECELWVNGRPLGKTTPIKELLLPSGNHTISFVSAQYHIIRNRRIQLGTGQKTTLRFAFGVLKLKLTPWARVRANNRDLGLWDKLGLPVGQYDLEIKAHDDSRKKKQTVMIRPGKIHTISRW